MCLLRITLKMYDSHHFWQEKTMKTFETIKRKHSYILMSEIVLHFTLFIYLKTKLKQKALPDSFLLSFADFLVFLEDIEDHLPFVLQEEGQIKGLGFLRHDHLKNRSKDAQGHSANPTGHQTTTIMLHECSQNEGLLEFIFISTQRSSVAPSHDHIHPLATVAES